MRFIDTCGVETIKTSGHVALPESSDEETQSVQQSVDDCDNFCGRSEKQCYGYSFSFAEKMCIIHVQLSRPNYCMVEV